MQHLIWLRRSRKRILTWLTKSIKQSLICIRESIELEDHQEVAADANDPIVLSPESITLFAEGISLMIPSQQAKLEMTVPNYGENRFNGTAECLKRKSDKFKQQIVKEMARRSIAFFIQPKGSFDICSCTSFLDRGTRKLRCGVEHVEFLLHELVRISFKYTIGKSTLDGTDIIFKLHQDFLPGKHKIVKELGETLRWTGKDHKEKLRKDEELELIRAHKANRERNISRRQRLKFRAYFV